MPKRDDLIRAMNEDLTAEISAIIRYTFQEDELDDHISVELREFFAREIEDEVGHAAFLTDVIAGLGGGQTTAENTLTRPTDLEEMLMLDLKLEWKRAASYMKHAKLAKELGELALGRKLEEMSDVTANHARELWRIIKRQRRAPLEEPRQADALPAY